MADVLTKEQRHFNMSQIRSRDTQPEIFMRRLLREAKLKGYRFHPKISGKPDIVFRRKRLAIFIDGCFWHRCQRCFVRPATRTRFWLDKIDGNVRRDKRTARILQSADWTVLRLWEHEIRRSPDKVINKLKKYLESDRD